jgi:NAD+ synthase (glutamine-hydrolysing)
MFSGSSSPSGDFGARVRVAACNLNQWAMDFDHNVRNVAASITAAKESGCTFRSGPELELTGYSCEDHFFELDTVMHAWESLCQLLPLTEGRECSVV